MKKYRKILLLALKIGIGSSIAIYIAQALHLEYDVSAGTVTFHIGKATVLKAGPN